MPLPSGLSVGMMFIRFRVVALLTLIGLVGLATQSSGPTRQAPRFWNDRELAEWAVDGELHELTPIERHRPATWCLMQSA